MGAVEGDEVVEAEEAAPEVHEAAVETLSEAAAVAEAEGSRTADIADAPAENLRSRRPKHVR